MTYNFIDYQKQDRRVTITLNRPDEANGLNLGMAQELAHAALTCSNDEEVKAVILSGSGRFFSVGGDVKSMYDLGDDVASGLKILADELHKAISVFARMDAPLIVAVNGTAAGAGFSMAICGDYVLASESAGFTLSYSKVGLSPDGSSSYYLPRLIGLRRAQDLMFTNRVLSADEALDWGLINDVVPADQLLSEANKLADMFVIGSKNSNATIKKLLLQTFQNGLETQMEIEGRAIAENSRSADGREGVKAFVKKRKPQFE
jgi:2-(1,2-epoxy-1,2-dihydrophenyl)acetyl-CoA isomerase